MTTPVWIGLGSNVGDRRAILDEALVLLGRTPGVAVAMVSSYRETQPVGGPPGQGAFLNAAAHLETSLSPRQLLMATQAIETALGRSRTVRWGERTLDVDLLIFGSLVVDEPDLRLPHPRLAVRRFVLEPLAEIAGQVADPLTRQTIRELLANLDRRPRIMMLSRSIQAQAPGLAAEVVRRLPGSQLVVGGTEFDELGGNSHLPAHREVLLKQIRCYREGLDSAVGDEVRCWVVDFPLDVPRLKEIYGSGPQLGRTVGVLARAVGGRPQVELGWQIAQELGTIPHPTVIVTGKADATMPRPGLLRTPSYQPDAGDSAGIAQELGAIWSGIESI